MKKPSKKPTAKSRKFAYRKLFLKAERLWKEIAFLRDGKVCQVARWYGSRGLQHSETLQVDHFITRGDHNLYFNPKNATVVCSNCNGAKKWLTGGVAEMIRRIVTDREGGLEVGIMTDIHVGGQPNLRWKDADWLELDIIPMLEAYKQEILNAKQNT